MEEICYQCQSQYKNLKEEVLIAELQFCSDECADKWFDENDRYLGGKE